MARSALPLLAAIGAALAGFGCVDPDGIANAIENAKPEPSITITARADGSGKTLIDACPVTSGVTCEGKTGSTGGLRASSESESVGLDFIPLYTASDGTEVGSYKAELQGNAEGKEIVVTWDTSHVFKVTLPAPVAFTEPAEGAVLSAAAAPISIAFEAGGGSEPIQWSLVAECSVFPGWSTGAGPMADTGSIVLTEAAFEEMIDEGGCPAKLEVEREREGSKESAREGSIKGIQARSRSFTITP